MENQELTEEQALQAEIDRRTEVIGNLIGAAAEQKPADVLKIFGDEIALRLQDQIEDEKFAIKATMFAEPEEVDEEAIKEIVELQSHLKNLTDEEFQLQVLDSEDFDDEVKELMNELRTAEDNTDEVTNEIKEMSDEEFSEILKLEELNEEEIQLLQDIRNEATDQQKKIRDKNKKERKSSKLPTNSCPKK